MGVSNEVAPVAREELVHAGAVVTGRVAEEHVQGRGDEDPEVPRAAFVLRLHEHPGGVGAEVGLCERVGPHGVDERPRERGELPMPAADRRARELDAVARVDRWSG